MSKSPSLMAGLNVIQPLKRFGAAFTVMAIAAAQATPAYATIDNTANANGTYNSGAVTTTTPSTVNVPVAPATPTLTVAKSAGAWVDVNADGVINGGDRITYSYVVTNTGNVTINGARPLDAGPQFNTVNGTGSLAAFSPVSTNLTPGSNQTFTAVYTLSTADAYRAAGINPATGNAVENSATATGTPTSGTLAAVTPSAVEVALPGVAKLSITKSWAFLAGPTGDVDGDGFADANDRIVYTYTVTNTGNVAVTGTSIADVHEGVALGAGLAANEVLVTNGPVGVTSDATPNNAVWTTIQAGGVVRFTYNHIVTQTEVDNG
jgi:hypothetical protein